MLSGLTNKERNWIWLLAAIGAAMRLLLAFRSPARIASRPYIEDAFYVFSCARHLALGHGFTVDGVHPTNGVQPLICLLYAPFFWLSADRWTGLQMTFILQAVLHALGTLLVASLVGVLAKPKEGGISPAIVAAAIWTFSMQLLIHNSNGLETGLVAVFLVAITRLLAEPLGWPRTVLLGVLCGLSVLARIDLAVFVAIVCGWLLIRRRASFAKILVTGLVTLVVCAPWFWYGYHEFGSIMPISGQSESSSAFELSTIARNAQEAVLALADIGTVFLYHQFGAAVAWANTLWVIVIFLSTIFVIRQLRTSKMRQRTVLEPLAFFGLFVLTYYIVFFGAPHFMSRYLHPIRILVVILIAANAPAVVQWFKGARLRRMAGLGALMVVAAFTIERYVNNFTTGTINDLYKTGVWAAEHPGASIGMEQSGISGFTADNVINLDGKVNWAALRAAQLGEIGNYIRTHTTHLADWPDLIQPTLSDAARSGAVFEPIDTIGRVVVYARRF